MSADQHSCRSSVLEELFDGVEKCFKVPKVRSRETLENHSSKDFRFERFVILCGEVPRIPKSRISRERQTGSPRVQHFGVLRCMVEETSEAQSSRSHRVLE
jgi:hypothetical protein